MTAARRMSIAFTTPSCRRIKDMDWFIKREREREKKEREKGKDRWINGSINGWTSKKRNSLAKVVAIN
jgi:hypothetical protein